MADLGTPVIMSGIIPIVYCPSEALLSVDLDVTGLFTSSEYMAWKEDVEDLLYQIDVAYALKSSMVKGRRIRASYKTVMTQFGKQRIRIINISPYPSRFNTILSNIRTKIYGSQITTGILPKYGEVIAQVQKGSQVVKLYLVPSSNITKLNDEIDALNKKLDELQHSIEEYENSYDFDKIIGKLKVVPTERWNRYPVTTKIYPIKIKHIPFVVSKDIIDSYIDERTREAVEETIKNAVASVAMDIQKKIKTIIEEYFGLLSKKYNAWDIKKLRRWTEQVKSLPEAQKWFRSEIEALESMIDAIESNDEDKMYDGLVRIASLVGVETYRRNPDEIYNDIINKFTSTISPSVRSLLDSL